MDWRKVFDKAIQQFATTGIGGAVAVVLTALIITLLPDLAVREDALFVALALICSSAANAIRNWWKHRGSAKDEGQSAKAALMLLLPVVALGFTACASLQEHHEDIVQTGLLVGVGAQETAEGAYSAVRDAWHKEAVTDEDMAKAIEFYAVYSDAHAAYKAALKAYDVTGATGSLTDAQGELLDAVAALTQLAERLGVF